MFRFRFFNILAATHLGLGSGHELGRPLGGSRGDARDAAQPLGAALAAPEP